MRKHSIRLTTRKMSHFLTTYKNRKVIVSHFFRNFQMTHQQKVPHATLHFPLFLLPGLPRSDTVLQEKSAQLSASHIEDSDPHMRKHSSRLTTRKMSHFLTTYKNPLVPLAKYRNVIMSYSPLSLAHDLPPSHIDLDKMTK